jgi:predicted TIM-barrel fold metal-dependent hydrolase
MADVEQTEDIKAVDMMNYPSEAGKGQYLFKWEEMRIMARTTFKSIWGGKVPTEQELKESGFMTGHPDVPSLLKTMDEVGFDYVVISDVKMWSYRYHFQLILDYGIEVINDLIKQGEGKLIGGASYNPFRIEDSLRDIEIAVKEYGFKYVYMHPITFGIHLNDKKLYPVYAKCNELGVSIGLQVGHSAEPLPSWVGHPYDLDEVAIDFPNLKINLSHTGYPWVDEWCSMIFRHENVYGDISAYNPKNLTPATVTFMSGGRGAEKTMFGSNTYGLKLTKDQFLALPIKDKHKKRILRDNAIEFLGLEK